MPEPLFDGQGVVRFVDLCAGIGGFHVALARASAAAGSRHSVECVLAAELNPRLRELYVRNFPDIAAAYALHHPAERCRGTPFEDLYKGGVLASVHGDIRDLVDEATGALRRWPGPGECAEVVPDHDLLCAGFPCQPFSKSGAQKGFADLNGTVFHLIARILQHKQPRFVLLENVGNFERHDGGNTWRRVGEVLRDLGYSFRATVHVSSDRGTGGLLSPHHIGLPHHRERFFVVAQHREKVGAIPPDASPFPQSYRLAADPGRARAEAEAAAADALKSIVRASASVASAEEFEAAQLPPERVRCINHWNQLLERIDESNERGRRYGLPASELLEPMPSFPIWGYELDPWQWYPIDRNPGRLSAKELARYHAAQVRRGRAAEPWGAYPPNGRGFLGGERLAASTIRTWKATWPPYARCRREWPKWKVQFIEQNRAWAARLWRRIDRSWLRDWLDELYTLLLSHQKLEWNCKGGDLDLWRHILQFRPSGLRAKRLLHVPAFVAMTSTQVPIVPRLNPKEPKRGSIPGARGRHLLVREALQLQGFPPDWLIPRAREYAYQAIGNAVHVDLVAALFRAWLFQTRLVTPPARSVGNSVGGARMRAALRRSATAWPCVTSLPHD